MQTFNEGIRRVPFLPLLFSFPPLSFPLVQYHVGEEEFRPVRGPTTSPPRHPPSAPGRGRTIDGVTRERRQETKPRDRPTETPRGDALLLLLFGESASCLPIGQFHPRRPWPIPSHPSMQLPAPSREKERQELRACVRPPPPQPKQSPTTLAGSHSQSASASSCFQPAFFPSLPLFLASPGEKGKERERRTNRCPGRGTTNDTETITK